MTEDPWDLRCDLYRDGCQESFPIAAGADVDDWWPRAEAAGWTLPDPEGECTEPYRCPGHAIEARREP